MSTSPGAASRQLRRIVPISDWERSRGPLREKSWLIEELKLVDMLVLVRNKLAAERTLMAWVRTALSIISFGFTIYKFLQVIDEQSPVPVLRPNAPRNVGLVLTGLGTFVVVIASIQHWSYVKNLSNGSTR